MDDLEDEDDRCSSVCSSLEECTNSRDNGELEVPTYGQLQNYLNLTPQKFELSGAYSGLPYHESSEGWGGEGNREQHRASDAISFPGSGKNGGEDDDHTGSEAADISLWQESYVPGSCGSTDPYSTQNIAVAGEQSDISDVPKAQNDDSVQRSDPGTCAYLNEGTVSEKDENAPLGKVQCHAEGLQLQYVQHVQGKRECEFLRTIDKASTTDKYFCGTSQVEFRKPINTGTIFKDGRNLTHRSVSAEGPLPDIVQSTIRRYKSEPCGQVHEVMDILPPGEPCKSNGRPSRLHSYPLSVKDLKGCGPDHSDGTEDVMDGEVVNFGMDKALSSAGSSEQQRRNPVLTKTVSFQEHMNETISDPLSMSKGGTDSESGGEAESKDDGIEVSSTSRSISESGSEKARGFKSSGYGSKDSKTSFAEEGDDDVFQDHGEHREDTESEVTQQISVSTIVTTSLNVSVPQQPTLTSSISTTHTVPEKTPSSGNQCSDQPTFTFPTTSRHSVTDPMSPSSGDVNDESVSVESTGGDSAASFYLPANWDEQFGAPLRPQKEDLRDAARSHSSTSSSGGERHYAIGYEKLQPGSSQSQSQAAHPGAIPGPAPSSVIPDFDTLLVPGLSSTEMDPSEPPLGTAEQDVENGQGLEGSEEILTEEQLLNMLKKAAYIESLFPALPPIPQQQDDRIERAEDAANHEPILSPSEIDRRWKEHLYGIIREKTEAMITEGAAAAEILEFVEKYADITEDPVLSSTGMCFLHFQPIHATVDLSLCMLK